MSTIRSSSCNACGATFRGRVTVCPNCRKTIESVLPEIRPGDVIDGKYEIVSVLGIGGMGQVFKVRHLHLSAFRTIKMLRRDLLADESYRVRFVREARLATRVQHPNVALVHDFATLTDGTYYMVSEFIDGVTLRQWMRKHGRFSVQLTLRLALQVLDGLDVIHRAGLMHRDLSSDNIMVTTALDAQPVAKIIDLGIAKVISAAVPAGDGGTQVGLFVGNPRYSSPEQLGALRDGEQIDARADLYCFGALLYEMLSGAPLFASSTAQGYAVKHITERPQPLRERMPELNIPPELDAIILRALEKNRENRFSSSTQMAAALRPFVIGPLTTTTQMKLDELREIGGEALSYQTSGSETPPPPAPDPMAEQIRLLAERGDISALSRLQELHPASTPIGKAVREALDRMAAEAFSEPAPFSAKQERAVWKHASESNAIDPLREYLELYPQGAFVAEAKQRIEQLGARAALMAFHAATDALEAGNPVPAEELLRTNPAANIRQRLELGLAKHQRRLAQNATPAAPPTEQDAWNEATKSGSERGWLHYLESHPESPRRREAISMLAETRDYERAVASGTEIAFRVYLATWPRGRHHAEAEAQLHVLLGGRRTVSVAPPVVPASPAPVPTTVPPQALPGTMMASLPSKTEELRVPIAEDPIVAAFQKQWPLWLGGLLGVAGLLYVLLH